ncbi:MAG: hypothetical protein H7Z14_18115, partial [Anaerolineae bacterium]|nr:hypothetical protein [Phycisphaerae bacterium]
VVRIPVLVTSGSTLTLFAANGTLSTVTGVPTGNIGNTAVALRGPDTAVNPNDSVTLQAGATLVMAGPGDKRIGSSNQGKPIVGRGTSAAEATIRADGRTYMTDIAVDNVNTNFVVAGSGNGGLRIEAPMNADYSGAIPTSGFFGLNPDQSPETLGNTYTIMSPSRFAGIASGGPAQGVDGSPISRGGVLTLAASDPAGASGTINNGPEVITPIALGFDNTAASGPIVYQIDPTGNGGKIANFSGLVLKRSGPSTVTTRLLNHTSMETLHQLAGTLDLNGKAFSTGGATLVSGNTIGGGTISAQFLATKTGTGTYTLGAGSRLITPLLSVSSGTLALSVDGSSASTSRVGTLSIAAGATMDLVDNDLIATNTSVATIQSAISNARNGGAWNQTGLTSSAARNATPKNKTLGVLKGSEYIGVAGTNFDGYNVGSNDTLVKFTYYGDTDFNGLVDFDDYSRVDAGFNNNRTGWFNGDVDYNGIVDFDDYSLIDQAFNTQSGTLRRAMAYLDGSDRSDAGMDAPSLQLVMERLSQFGEQYAAGFLNSVPEPGIGASIVVTGMAAMKRRRRAR